VLPETPWSFHCKQPAQGWRLHRWLAKPDKPATGPHASEKTGSCYTDKQCKVEGKGGEGKGGDINY